MPAFNYEAIDTSGKTVQGILKAEVMQDVENSLFEKGFTPISVTPVGDSAGQSSEGQSFAATFMQRFKKKSLDDLILFCQQVATMLSAGVAMLSSLKIIGEQFKNIQFKETIRDIADNIESGTSLSDAVGKHPHLFDTLFVNLIRVGEESGNLDGAFTYLADLSENEKDIKERIKTVTRYPKMLMSVMLIAVFFLMSFVVPKFLKMFTKSDMELPFATKLLVLISDFFSNNYLLIIIGVAALIYLYKKAMAQEKYVRMRDEFALRIPYIGELTTKIHMTRFCRVFSVLTASGIDIVKTIELSSTSLGNFVLRELMAVVKMDIEKGVNFFDAMARHKHFPPMVVQMIAVGEESGQLDVMMGKVSDFYEKETDYMIKNMSSFIEPVLLLVMGSLVGFIALAIFSPMWSMMDVMKGGG